MKIFDKNIFEALYKQANDSSIKRSHLLLHNNHQDKVQRLYIALVEGSYVEPHYHELDHQWEMFFVIEGKIEVAIYDQHTNCIIKNIFVGPNESISAIELSPCEIHSIRCLSKKSLILEIKEGPFDPNYAKKFIS